MSYVDYSANFVLDQFFTFLNANQLGANDEHLYDTLAVEHNINTATVDGTHKANSILGSYINTTSISTGSVVVTGFVTWTPAVGVYQVVFGEGMAADCFLELYISGAWRKITAAALLFMSGIVFCDGSNMRFNSSSSGTLWYQKFN